jgi:hypothetical protein
MAQSNIPEFLYENSFRSFPFVYSSELEGKLSNSSILDLKAFSKWPTDGSARLIAITRWNDLDAKPVCPPEINSLVLQGKIQLFFRLSAALVLEVDVPLNSAFPLSTSTQIQNEAETEMAGVSAIIGESILTDFSSSQCVEFEDVFSEPTTLIDLYKISLDELTVEHSNDDPDEFIKGKLIFSSGKNSYAVLSDNLVRIIASPGAGEGNGVYEGEDNICDGISSVNGAAISEGGVFKIIGENGIIVESDPSNHKVLIYVDTSANVNKCP